MELWQAEIEMQLFFNDGEGMEGGSISVEYTLSSDGDEDVLLVMFRGDGEYPASAWCAGTDELWGHTRVPDDFDDEVGRLHYGGTGFECFLFLRKGSPRWVAQKALDLKAEIKDLTKVLEDVSMAAPREALREMGIPVFYDNVNYVEGVLPKDAVLLSDDECRQFVNLLSFRCWDLIADWRSKQEGWYAKRILLLRQELDELV